VHERDETEASAGADAEDLARSSWRTSPTTIGMPIARPLVAARGSASSPIASQPSSASDRASTGSRQPTSSVRPGLPFNAFATSHPASWRLISRSGADIGDVGSSLDDACDERHACGQGDWNAVPHAWHMRYGVAASIAVASVRQIGQSGISRR
jgi:hypothetical protein